MDMKLKKVMDLIPLVNINISMTNEHVTEVERRNLIIKERCQGILVTLPFAHFPQQLIISVMMCMNMFPSSTEISRMWRP